MVRDKMFVEYPIAKSLEEAIAWMEEGNEVWQEDSNDWPSCGGFDTVEDLRYNFTDGIDETHNIHLVTKVPEKAKPFEVGDEIVSLEELDHCCGKEEGEFIDKGTVCYIDRIDVDKDSQQKLYFKDHADKYGPWKADCFVYNVCSN